MKRAGIPSLVGIIVATLAGLALALGSGWTPLLGLDLQGGVSVVLQPTSDVDEERLSQAISIIRSRVDALGVAEPDITRQGENIVVQLPGVDDQDRALELVGQTAELRFRPVLARRAPPGALGTTDTTAADGTTDTTAGDGTTDTTAGTTTTTADGGSTTTSVADDEESLGELVPAGLPRQSTTTTAAGGGDESTTTTTSADGGSTTTTAADGGSTTTTVAGEGATSASGCPATPDTEAVARLAASDELTTPEEDIASDPVLLAEYDGDEEVLWYLLGCTELRGTAISDAQAALVGVSEWIVEIDFESGQDGVDGFNDIATRCFSTTAVCPTGALAIVLDGRVISAPSINNPTFDDGATISGSFTQSEAQDLATVLRFGALPVELEPQQTQEVSATIGQDALDAGIIAGVVGLLLVAVYIISYYRLLGVVAMVSLAISFGLLWAIIAYLGDQQGLALTLAGVTGIIVSIGVSVDSNIVYFEHLKEDIRSGRSVRSSADKAWSSAFSTIVKADLASLIGAGLLYWLTVGPVRGFAFYLGLATLLDLVASYFFLRPAVQLLARSDRFQDNPGPLGLPSVPEHLRIS